MLLAASLVATPANAEAPAPPRPRPEAGEAPTVDLEEVTVEGPMVPLQEPSGPYQGAHEPWGEGASGTVEGYWTWRVDRYRVGPYFRFGLGVGNSFDRQRADGQDLGTATGLGWAAEAAFGWYLRPGLALALSVDVIHAPSSSAEPELSVGPLEIDTSQHLVLGPLVDWYPDPRGGFHGQLGAGVSGFVAGRGESSNVRTSDHVAVGFGAVAGVGYEWWIASDWSLGFLARFLYHASSTASGVTWNHRGGGFSLMATASWD